MNHELKNNTNIWHSWSIKPVCLITTEKILCVMNWEKRDNDFDNFTRVSLLFFQNPKLSEDGDSLAHNGVWDWYKTKKKAA